MGYVWSEQGFDPWYIGASMIIDAPGFWDVYPLDYRLQRYDASRWMLRSPRIGGPRMCPMMDGPRVYAWRCVAPGWAALECEVPSEDGWALGGHWSLDQ